MLEYAAQNNIILMFPQSGDTREISFAPDLQFCWVGAYAYTRDHP